MQPWVRAFSNPLTAQLARDLNPLRLSYTAFADGNPWMTGVKELAAEAAAHRKPVANDNPFLTLQTQISDQITAALDAYRAARDQMSERMFFGFYGSPAVQALIGVGDDVRPPPGPVSERPASGASHEQSCAAKLRAGGFDEALARAILFVTAAERTVDPYCALALCRARQHLAHLSLDQFKTLVRGQFSILQIMQDQAVDALTALTPKAEDRKILLERVQSIVGAGAAPTATQRDRLARLSKVWAPRQASPSPTTPA
jgi:hypothetical protein